MATSRRPPGDAKASGLGCPAAPRTSAGAAHTCSDGTGRYHQFVPLAHPPAPLPSPRYTPYTGKVENLPPKDTGRLKPDLFTEELLAKRAAKERVKLFSKNLKTVNRQIIEDQIEFAPPKPPAPREPSKHEKMRQYAVQVRPPPYPGSWE